MTQAIASQVVSGAGYLGYRIDNLKVEASIIARFKRLNDLSEKLEANYRDLCSRGDEENRLHIANTRYNQPQRYFSDPVYEKLNQVYRDVVVNDRPKCGEESRRKYVLDLTSHLIVFHFLKQIELRRMPQMRYESLLSLSEAEVKDRIIAEAEVIFNEERKKQGWFSFFKEYHNHKAAQASYTRIDERYRVRRAEKGGSTQ